MPECKSKVRPIPSDLPRVIGRYHVAEQLGAGGMGIVHRVVPTHGGAPMAMKILAEHLNVEDGWARFQREMDALDSLRHPNIVRLVERGWWLTRPYFVMELVDGPDLTTLLRQHGPQPLDRTLSIVAQLASALWTAHRAGLVHRDLKPSNVMLHLDEDGTETAKLMDFGLVFSTRDDGPRITAESLMIGTPGYVAPEGVASPWALDARSDVYALAMVAYYLRTGRHLFEPKDVVDRDEHIRALGVGAKRLREVGAFPDPLWRALWSCLRYDPADRPDPARALRDIVALGGAEAEPTSRLVSWWRRATSPPRRTVPATRG